MKEIYFIVHVEHPRLGWLESWAKQNFDRVHIKSGVNDTLPLLESIDASSPVVVMGGPMGVYDTDKHAWLVQEQQLIGQLLHRGQPMLGVCLGGQLFAHCLGHMIKSCPLGTVECGYYPLYRYKKCDKELIDDHIRTTLPPYVYQWHQDGIFWQEGGEMITRMAYSDWMNQENIQAFVYKNALGLQFHPEVTEDSIKAWLERDYLHLLRQGARDASTHLSDHAQHHFHVRQWLLDTLAQTWDCFTEEHQPVWDLEAFALSH